MKTKKYTDEQKLGILKELDAGVPIKELCRKYGISDGAIYYWKSKMGGMSPSDVKRMRQLEEENRKLKRIVADQQLDLVVLKDIVAGKL